MTAPLVGRVRDRLAWTDSAGIGPASVLRGPDVELIADAVALRELDAEIDAELTGAGVLEPLLALDGVTDVLVNAPDEVWIDRGHGLERTDVAFVDDDAVRRLAVRLASRTGRRLDDAMPWVDATLPDGTRLHAVLPPLVAHPVMSLRVLRRRRLSLDDLVSLGAMPADLAVVLRGLVSSCATVLVSGGTGSGKTTLMSALLAGVPATERILSIEDTAELNVDHPHVVGLVSRPANLEGAGRVTLADLVRQALRMRPDRLVVGEFRGAEVIEVITALNTGHSGGLASIHANSALDVPGRLVALGALSGADASTVLALARTAVDVVVHLERAADGRRYVKHIAVWNRADGDLSPALAWSAAGEVCPAQHELGALSSTARSGRR